MQEAGVDPDPGIGKGEERSDQVGRPWVQCVLKAGVRGQRGVEPGQCGSGSRWSGLFAKAARTAPMRATAPPDGPSRLPALLGPIGIMSWHGGVEPSGAVPGTHGLNALWDG